ncbi:hypothetical protein [Bradyrhizobium sp. 191]|uniref:hypothetical protein n=1 Tax=Bradyrhizobium sp. 191 TaxID=2782659 RepID=UPI001FFE8B1E|nr:hypothetical protein [Bradyrhizobium sp. 191]UPJ63695.1 hypothetical protein IVB23_27325 [Bradyrhizobium sp. 191]
MTISADGPPSAICREFGWLIGWSGKSMACECHNQRQLPKRGRAAPPDNGVVAPHAFGIKLFGEMAHFLQVDQVSFRPGQSIEPEAVELHGEMDSAPGPSGHPE